MKTFLLIISLFSFNLMADQDFDKILGQIEAHSKDDFFKLAKMKKVDGCEMLEKKFDEHNEGADLQVRIFFYLDHSECKQKLSIIKKALNSKYEVVLINSLRSLKKLDKSKRMSLKSQLTKIGEKYKNDGTISSLVKDNLGS